MALRNEYLSFFCLLYAGSFILIFCTQHYLVLGEDGVIVKQKSDCSQFVLSQISDAVVPDYLLPSYFEELQQYGCLVKIGYVGYDLNKLS